MVAIPKGTQVVYFIRPVGRTGPVKIGCTHFHRERLAQLADWSPLPLEIAAMAPGNELTEAQLHACFADHWSHREWFRENQRLTELIVRLASGVPLHEAIDLPAHAVPLRQRRFAPGNRERELYHSYRSRLAYLVRKADQEEPFIHHLPKHVQSALNKWKNKANKGQSLDAETVKMLDGVIEQGTAMAVRAWRSRRYFRPSPKEGQAA